MKKIFVLCFVFIILITLCSCGSKSVVDSLNENIESKFSYSMNDMGYDSSNSVYQEKSEKESEKSDEAVDGEKLQNSRKLIRDASLSIQTKKFDEYLSAFEGNVSSSGGYIQSSDISGNGYGYTNERYAEITARIPSEKLDEFLDGIAENAVITSKNISVRDVTSDYIDTESKIKALETEQDALLQILSKAETVSDTIEVQSRLSEVRGEIESYKSRIKTYDELISYSTVTVDIREVEVVTYVENTGYFTEIKERLTENLHSLLLGLRSFSIWFITSLPYFVVFGIIIFIAVFVIIKIKKKRKSRKNNSQ